MSSVVFVSSHEKYSAFSTFQPLEPSANVPAFQLSKFSLHTTVGVPVVAFRQVNAAARLLFSVAKIFKGSAFLLNCRVRATGSNVPSTVLAGCPCCAVAPAAIAMAHESNMLFFMTRVSFYLMNFNLSMLPSRFVNTAMYSPAGSDPTLTDASVAWQLSISTPAALTTERRPSASGHAIVCVARS